MESGLLRKRDRCRLRRYVAQATPRMPEGIRLTPFNDASRILKGRRDLLLRTRFQALLQKYR